MPINIEDLNDCQFTDNIKPDQQSAIFDLARELAYNYYSNSFGDEFNVFITRSQEIFRTKSIVDDFGTKIDRKERVRNILVVGAGASHDSYKAFPTGYGLIEEVRASYETEIRTIKFLENKFDTEAEEIQDLTGKELNFENYLYLLSKFFVNQKDLREKIKDMTGFRYSVSLFNEIVAHMLKHSFIDVVVNFNFEETLDHAIEEEIGKGNYHNIIYDGNCVGLEQVLVDGRLKVPIYIKPHGTFSHKSTLRFTNRHYFDLPNDIRIMLEGLMSGQRGDSEISGKKQIQRVNLILVGFALESLEFNKILDKCLPADSVIYQLDWKKPKDNAECIKYLKDRSLSKFLDRASRRGRKIEEIYVPFATEPFSQNQGHTETGQKNEKRIPGPAENTLSTPFGEIFSVLWRICFGFFKDNYKPRSIARHEILSYLFFEPRLSLLNIRTTDTSLAQRIKERSYIQDYYETHPKLFRNRILVELALVLNRSNGMVDIAELLKGRIGFYYSKYMEAHETYPNRIKDKLTIFELVNQFSLEHHNEQYGPGKKGAADPENYFPGEYKNGKNLFVLSSIFTKEEFGNVDLFEDKVRTLKDRLVDHFKSLNIASIDPIGTYGDLEAKSNRFGECFATIIWKWYDKKQLGRLSPGDEYERVRFERTITIFYLLMISPVLSRHFKVNFINNFDQPVRNGKVYSKSEVWQGPPPIMLYELLRLLAKSASQHYFIIDPLPYSPVHYIWESFKRRNLVHTILGLSAEFNYLFKHGEWDALLLVSETGSLLNFLHKVEPEERLEHKIRCRNREIILICSFEAVSQLYPDTTDKERLIAKHKQYVSMELGGGEAVLKNLTVLLVNFNQHNHHVTIFLKSVSPINNDILGSMEKKFTVLTDHRKYHFMAMGSLYNHRQGFSNSIDPVHIGLVDIETTSQTIQRDQQKMIDIFVVHLVRAFQFELFHGGNKSWIKDPFLNRLLLAFKKNTHEKIGAPAFLLALYKRLMQIHEDPG